MASQRAAARPGVWSRAVRSRRVEDTPAAAPLSYLRLLQLALAAIWLLDGVLQYQDWMFSRGFAQMLAEGAGGNPAVIADPITWSARIVAQNPTWTNALFAAIQVALGLGIAWRRTLRPALAASIVWSLAVWWLGEGLGGVLTSNTPITDAPGAVILYALLAVLVWPVATQATRPSAAGSFVASGLTGARVARGLWLILWGSMAFFAARPSSRTPQSPHDMIAGMAGGEPGWLAAVNRGAAGLLAQHGFAAAITLAVVFAVIAAGGLLPAPFLRVAVVLAVLLSLLIWVVGQDLGAILAGGATDVNSGPLLALIALAYWPLRSAPAASEPAPATGPAALVAGDPADPALAVADETAVGPVGPDGASR